MYLFKNKTKKFEKRSSKIKILIGGAFILSLFTIGPRLVSSESLDVLRNMVNTLTQQREGVENEVNAFDAQIKFLSEQLAKTDAEIAENENKIKEIQKELTIQKEYLSESLRVTYEESQTSFAELIVGSNTFSDFVDKHEYLSSAQDELKDTTNRINYLKRELVTKRMALKQAKAIQKVFKESLEKQKAEKEVTLANLKDEEKRIREQFAIRLNKAGVSPYCAGSGKVIKAKYSVFSFPVDCGYISQGFGMTEFASIDKAYRGNIHNGIDVGIGTGTEIRSVGQGTVYAKGTTPSGGWGNWVMVKQDKVKVKIGNAENEYEFYSLYAHMVAESHLKAGDRVNTRDVIGFVGGTPYWAPHLHFSLFLTPSEWRDGAPGPYPGNVIDPLDYMDIPISTSGTDWDPNYLHF